MIREQKNKFWLTLILILSLSFSVFALGVANVFNNRKTNPTLPVDAAEEESLSVQKWVTESGQETTSLGELKGGSTFTIMKKKDTTTFQGEEVSDIVGTRDVDERENVSYISNYTITIKNTKDDSEITYSPVPHFGYKVIGFKLNETEIMSSDLENIPSVTYTSEQIDPEYSGKIIIEAVCEPIEYELKMYVSKDGSTWEEEPVSFNAEESTTLQNLPNVGTEGCERSFKNWAILTSYVDQNNGDFIVVDNINFGAINNDNNPAEADVFTAGDGKTYYYITNVQGYSSTIVNDWYAGTKHESSFNPAIRAVWSYVYNGVVNNSNPNKKPIDENKYGAFVGTTEAKQANLKFSANVDSYGYGFFKNTGYAFETDLNKLKDNNVFGASGKYGVYNYGHEVTGWKISFANGTNPIYGPVYSGSNWTYEVNPSEISIETLESVKICDLAESLDTFFISGYDNREINLIPSWQTVNINVHVENSELKNGETNTKIASTTYNSTYAISDGKVFVPAGQMIYAYKTKDESIIAKNHNNNPMPWNYVNIAQDQFDKNGDIYKFADGTYKLTVEPICVDNIYKISLTSDKNLGGNENVYTLEKTQQEVSNVNQYKFAVGSENPVDIVDITTANLINKYDHYSTGLIEDYISSKVSPIYTEYNDAITDGTLDILRNVFTTNPRVAISSTDQGDNLKCTGLTNFYIYLANNKPAGDLPVFKYGHYDLISWDNIGSNKSGNVKRAYETYKYNEDFHKAEFDTYDCYLNHTHTSDCKKIRNLNDDPFWKYSEMNTSMELQAHFFRKNYLLDLNTLREDSTNEGRYGYIFIEITEEDATIKGSADDKGGKFIAVYDKITNQMQYFDVTNGYENINSIASKNPFVFTKSDLLFTDAEGNFIKLYAGCTLQITASCVDYLWTNAKDGEDTFPYLDMVGYYLSSVKTTTKINGSLDNEKEWFGDENGIVDYASITNKKAGKHEIVLESGDKDTQGTIEYLQCPSGSKIEINAYFAPIDYEISISLKTNGANNPFAGRVDCDNKTTLPEINKEIIYFENANIENWTFLVEYLSNAGYTLSENAFVAYNKEGGIHLLLGYDNSQNTSDVNSQSYPFILNGEWLLNYYYLDAYDARTNNQQILALDVNTELFEFDYNVEFVDENGNPLTNDNRSNYNNGTIVLNGKNDANNIAIFTINNRKNGLNLGDLTDKIDGYQYNKISKALIGNEFEKINDSEDFYVIKILTCANADAGHTHTADCYTNYVVLESWLPYSVLGNNNYKIIYEFLLKESHLTSGDENGTLTQSVMNNIFGFGEIVNTADRILTTRIKVSQLYTITLKAEQHSTYPDPCLEYRTTTIKNHDTGFENFTNSGTLTTIGSDFTNSVVIYTYKGVENVLSSTFNEVAYEGVAYRLGDSASNLEGNTFTLDETKVDDNGNIEVIVTYIPKPITTFNVTYQLNGIEDNTIFAKNGSTITSGKLIQELSNTSNISLYFGQSINYEYKLLNEEGYTVSITLNGAPVSGNPIVCQVTEKVYNYKSGGFFIIVNVISIDREEATVMYILDDATKAFADDVYGELDLFVNGSIATDVTMMGNMYVVSVAEGKKLSVDISNMAKGYSFVSLNRASTPLETVFEDGKLVITNSFSFEENNTYFVVIKKDTIRATLTLDDVDSDYVSYYNMTTSGEKTNVSGNIKSVDAYLGKTLEFTNVDKEREVLNYYYYTDKDGVEHEIKVDGNGKLTLTLTNDVLNQLGDKVDGVYNINIGVKITKKYKLTYSVVNEIYAEPVELTLVDNGKTYQNGTSMIKGTTVNVSVVAKDNVVNIDGITIDEAKYDIILSDCDIVDANGNILTNAEKKAEFTQGIANGFVVLDADKTLTITITQKTYSTTNNEFIYNNIDSYNSLTPTASTENIGSFNIDGDVKYGNTVTARFNRAIVGKGQLAVVRLSGNDSKSLIVHIKDKQIISVLEYVENNDGSISGTEYVINTDNAKHSAVAGVKIEEIANLKDKLQEFGYNFNINNNDVVEITYTVKNLINIKTEYLSYKTIKPII